MNSGSERAPRVLASVRLALRRPASRTQHQAARLLQSVELAMDMATKKKGPLR